MNTIIKTIPVLFLFIAISQAGICQKKYEKEYRINNKIIPARALSFVDSLHLQSKIKWYKEEGLNSTSIEAKGKIKKNKISVEFSENGDFQDLEIEISATKVPDAPFSKMTSTFMHHHKWYQIEKIQIQYKGNRSDVFNCIINNENHLPNLVISYEVILITKIKGEFLRIEYTFSQTGEYIKSKQIIESKNDTLDSGT